MPENEHRTLACPRYRFPMKTVMYPRWDPDVGGIYAQHVADRLWGTSERSASAPAHGEHHRNLEQVDNAMKYRYHPFGW